MFRANDIIYGFYGFWRITKISPSGILTVNKLVYEQEVFEGEGPDACHWYIRKKLIQPIREEKTMGLPHVYQFRPKKEFGKIIPGKYTCRKLSEDPSSVSLLNESKDYLVVGNF